MDFSSVDTANWIAISILEFMGIFMLLWVITFYRLRHLEEIYARRFYSSFLAGILNTFGCIIVWPFILITLNMKSVPLIPYIPTLCNCLAMVCSTGVYHIFSYRGWMVYFDIKFNKALRNAKWRLELDPDETNWFLNHKTVWGKGKRIATLLFIHWFFWSTTAVIVCILNGGFTSIISRSIVLISGLGPFIFDIVIYLKFPSFSDIFSVSDEIKSTLRCELLQMVIYYGLAIVINADYYTHEYVVMLMVCGGIAFIFVLVIHWRVFTSLGLPTLPWNIGDINSMMIMANSSRSYVAYDGEYVADGVAHPRIALKDILMDKHGFDEFALHVSKEFSLESLLFFVETHQWIQCLANKKKYSAFEVQKRIQSIKLPDNAPLSRIVQNEKQYECDVDTTMPSTCEYLQCVELFEKYIPESAYFAINISFETRTEIVESMGLHGADVDQLDSEEMVRILKEEKKMNKEQLFHVFDDAREEIYRLLMHAFSRFKTADAYLKIVSESISVTVTPGST